MSESEMDNNSTDSFHELLLMEQGLVGRLRGLTVSLPENDPYRVLLDRHLRELERLVGRLESLQDESGRLD